MRRTRMRPIARCRNIFDTEGQYCQMFGITPGEIDDMTGVTVRFRKNQPVDQSTGLCDRPSSSQTLCSTCYEGAKSIATKRPNLIWLKSQVNRAAQSEQRAVFEWLSKRFGS